VQQVLTVVFPTTVGIKSTAIFAKSPPRVPASFSKLGYYQKYPAPETNLKSQQSHEKEFIEPMC